MQEYIVSRNKGPALKFNGEVIAEVSTNGFSRRNTATYQTKSYIQKRLYRTAGGKYVGETFEVHIATDAKSKHRGAVFTTPEAALDFFGSGGSTRLLLEKAGLQAFELVD